ncbi:MAG: alpha/beta hydrolase [Proteobacteria bacterium]|nr:alpha/beta hydrolase [Pseudomonadota bacterium]
MNKAPSKFNGQAVVLVHGLWMSRWSFASIAKYLQKQGYAVYSFGYRTSSRPFDFNVQKLTAFVNSKTEDTVHLVVHSLGGILAMRSLPMIRKAGKLIMLGSSINGATVARAMGKKRWTAWMLKHATEPLENGVPNPTVFRNSMMIAGTSNSIGIARIVIKLPEPNDGTVTVADTQADWINTHITEKTNHFNMLFRKNIKQHIIEFLTETDSPNPSQEEKND